MYVKNGKISSRQTFRLYVFDLMGIATLLLPPYLAKLCGIDGIFAILAGTGLGYVYLFYLGWIMKGMRGDFCSFLERHVDVTIRKITYLWVLLHSVFTAGFCAYIFANLMKYSLVKESAYEVILLVIVVAAVYAVSGGIESRARVYEVLFWFVLIPYAVMMLASTRNFEGIYIQDFFATTGSNLGKGMYLVFLFLTPLFFVLFLVGEKEKNYGRNMIKTVGAAIFLTAVILLCSYVLLLGNFGTESLAKMKYPIVTLMSTIQFKGNFLKRMDALMLAVWFFTLYALLNLHLHYGTKMLKELRKKENAAKWWNIGIPSGLVYGIAYLMFQYEEWILLFLDYYSYIAVPLMILVPLVLVFIGRKKYGRKV